MANFGRVKTWGNEILQPTDLNAEFDNIINNVTNNGINSANIDETDNYSWSGTSAFSGAVTLTSTLTVGVDDTGHDVKFFGATASKYWLWDESADKMIVTGDASVSGATTLTGVTTHGGNVVSDTDSTDDLGTTTVRWANLYVDSIGDTGQALAITAGANNVNVTAGTLAVTGAATVSSTLGVTSTLSAATGSTIGNLTFANGSITDSSGAISFGDENLSTTGTLGAGATTVTTLNAVTDQNASTRVYVDNGTNGTSANALFNAWNGTVGGTFGYWSAANTDVTGFQNKVVIAADGETDGIFINAGSGNTIELGFDTTPTITINASGMNGTVGATTPAAATVTTLTGVSATLTQTADAWAAEIDNTNVGAGNGLKVTTANADGARYGLYVAVGASSAVDALVVKNTGAVGIGTASPDDLLHVWGSDAGSVSALAGIDVVVERATTAGYAVLTNDAGAAYIMAESPSSTRGGNYISWQYNGGTEKWNFTVDNTLNLTLQNATLIAKDSFTIQQTTDAGVLYLSGGSGTNAVNGAQIYLYGMDVGGTDSGGDLVLRAGYGGDAGIHFNTGNATRATIDASGNLGLGVSAFGTSAAKVLGISADGTVPSTSPAGMIQIFADDSSDGAANATLALRTEQAVEDIGTFTATKKLKIWINGVEYWIQLDAV